MARFPLLLRRDTYPCARATLIIRLVYRLDAYKGVKSALELCRHACARSIVVNVVDVFMGGYTITITWILMN